MEGTSQLEALQSRAIGVYGVEGLKKLTASSVSLLRLGGLGVEIAKNIMLAGVQRLTLWDDRAVELGDLGTQFFLTPEDIGKNRADACYSRLVELNSGVQLSTCTDALNESLISKFGTVVLLDGTEEELAGIGRICHKLNIPFVAGDMKGVFGYVFVDFGETFTVTDWNGEEPPTHVVTSITHDENGVVNLIAEERHGLSSGDYVIFEGVEGMTELNDRTPRQITVNGLDSFKIGNTSHYQPYIRGGYVKQVKMPVTINFKSYEESVSNPAFTEVDWSNPDLPKQLHIAFRALREYRRINSGSLPAPHNSGDRDKFMSLVKAVKESCGSSVDINEKVMTQFSYTASGELSPMAALFGGIIAQEVTKALTSKFTPVNQWLYFGATECLPDESLPASEFEAMGTRYDRQIAVFGRSMQNKLQNLKYFVVGAGALGCEVLKNFAMMGIGTGPDGYIHLTDMDTIEISNLNRQFLYRSWDVQKLKSTTAAAAVSKMNPAIKIHAHSLRVGQDTEDFFNDGFFEALDGVCNALDNVDARLYVDQRCVFNRKSLLESGTLGTQGNVQVVVPHQTVSYGSDATRDPPEKGIPLCTLKNFPYAIEHTLQWARDAFEGQFTTTPNEVNTYISNADYIQQLRKQPIGTRLATLTNLCHALIHDRPTNFADCISWARRLFEEFFSNILKQLVFSFPADMISENGSPFWSPPKRAPTPIEFNPSDPFHIQFVIAAANLRAEVFNIEGRGIRDVAYFADVISSVIVPEFAPNQNAKIQAKEGEQPNFGDEDEAQASELEKQLISKAPADSMKGFTLNPLSFEKDDDTNHHIDFIAATGNLRARAYKIPECDRFKAKSITGRIIPAIATTTACVTGFVCLELYKLIQGKSIGEHRNTFLNLALPFFGFSDPIAPPKSKLGEWEWSLWDSIDIEGDITLNELVQHFKTKFGLSVSMLSSGQCMIYSDFMPAVKAKERMPKRISELVQQITKVEVPAWRKYVVVEVCCLNDEDEDIETPYVRLKLR